MKKIKFPKFKIKNFQIGGFLNYIISILLSSAILALVLISLPLTERVTSSATYDLVNKKNLYWSKEYILELDTSSSIREMDDVENTRSIIQKRLRRYGVEESSVLAYKEDNINYLRVGVQTSKELEIVDTLVNSPFILKVVTRNPDIDFDNPEDPIAQYLIQNYELTEFTRNNFRNIYITKLKNSANEYSYFALFKTWPWENKWDDFLNNHAGEIIGIGIDQFVTPMQVPTDGNIFAVPVSSTEKRYADVTSILYNSGVVPVTYTAVDEIEIPVNIAELDYIKLTEGILIAVLLIYIYLLFVEKTPKDILIKSGLSTVITVSAWITYLKISETPVDIFLLALHVISVIALIRIITENTE